VDREDQELLKVYSYELGLENGEGFVDGIYHINYSINDNLYKNRKILLYHNLGKEIEDKLKEYNYEITLDNEYIKYDSSTADGDIEELNLLNYLYSALKTEAMQITPNEANINDIILKINRLLLTL